MSYRREFPRLSRHGRSNVWNRRDISAITYLTMKEMYSIYVLHALTVKIEYKMISRASSMNINQLKCFRYLAYVIIECKLYKY